MNKSPTSVICFMPSTGRSAPLRRELHLHPDTVRAGARHRALPQPARPARPPYRSLPRLSAPDLAAISSPACHPPLPDDSAARLPGQRQPTPPRRGRTPPAPPARPFCVCARSPVSRRRRIGRTSAKSPRPRPPAFIRLRPHPLLQPCLVVGILPRPEPGAFSPGPRPCLSRLGWSATEPADRFCSGIKYGPTSRATPPRTWKAC